MTVNTLGADMAGGKARAAAWLPPLVPIAIATFALSALVSYHLRADGAGESRSLLQSLIIGVYQFVGFAPSFMFFFLVLAWSSIWFVTGRLERPGVRIARLLSFTLALAIWTNLDEPLPHTGALGAWIGGRMVSVLGSALSYLLVLPFALVSVFLATDYFFVSYLEGSVGRRKAEPEDEVHGDAGVEAAVTEEFKSLSRLFSATQRATPARAPTPPLGDLVAIEDLEAAVAGMEAANADDGRAPTAAEAADEDDGEEMPSRRLSYFERRQLAAAAAAAAAAAESAVDDPEAAHVEDDDAVDGDADESADDLADEDREGIVEIAAAAGAVGVEAERDADEDAEDADEDDVADEFSIAAAAIAGEAAREAVAELDAAATADDGDAELDSAAPAPRAGDESDAADDEADDEAGPAGAPRGRLAPVADGEEDSDLGAPVVVPRAGAADVEAGGAAEPVDEGALDEDAEELTIDEDDAEDDADFDALTAVGAASDEPQGGSVAAADEVVEAAAEAAPPVAAELADEAADETEDDGVEDEAVQGLAEVEPSRTIPVPEAPVADEVAEPIVSIPRPPEGVRQQRLFVSGLDESLVREAIDIVESSRRASAAMLQRKLRIDFDQAVELLALLAHRGLIELGADGTQGRVLH